MKKDIANRARDACADAWNFFKSFDSMLVEDVGHRTRQTPQHVRGIAIRLGAKPVRPLLSKNICDFIQPSRDLDVRASAHASSNL